jgi:hypothetical protein
MIRNPRGHSVVSVVAAVVVVVVAVVGGAVGVGILAAINQSDCNVDVFWGCPASGGGGGGGGGGGTPAPAPQSCTSSPNDCGLTNTGTVQSDGSCSASAPPDSSCPEPTIPTGTGFYADPSLAEMGSSTVLYWNTTNTTSCTVTGGPLAGGGTTYTGSGSGNVSTGAINGPTTYTLTCQDGANGGPETSATLTIHTIPRYEEL